MGNLNELREKSQKHLIQKSDVSNKVSESNTDKIPSSKVTSEIEQSKSGKTHNHDEDYLKISSKATDITSEDDNSKYTTPSFIKRTLAAFLNKSKTITGTWVFRALEVVSGDSTPIYMLLSGYSVDALTDIIGGITITDRRTNETRNLTFHNDGSIRYQDTKLIFDGDFLSKSDTAYDSERLGGLLPSNFLKMVEGSISVPKDTWQTLFKVTSKSGKSSFNFTLQGGSSDTVIVARLNVIAVSSGRVIISGVNGGNTEIILKATSTDTGDVYVEAKHKGASGVNLLVGVGLSKSEEVEFYQYSHVISDGVSEYAKEIYLQVNEVETSGDFNTKGRLLENGQRAFSPNNLNITDSLASTDSSVYGSAKANKLLNDLIKNKVEKVAGKSLSTNDYTQAEKDKLGQIDTNSNSLAKGTGSGSVAFTINDGYGNANLTFNHRAGVPDNVSVTQSAYRMVAAVDADDASWSFQLGAATKNGEAVSLATNFAMYRSAAGVAYNKSAVFLQDMNGKEISGHNVRLSPSSGANITRVCAETHIVATQITNSYTLVRDSFVVGDLVYLYAATKDVTQTLHTDAGAIYFPDGSVDTSLSLTGNAKATLVKFDYTNWVLISVST